MMDIHEFGIQCRQCKSKWRISLQISGNPVEVFATICECGAIIVGNFNQNLLIREESPVNVSINSVSKDRIYLSNGHFDVLELDSESVKKLPMLALE